MIRFLDGSELNEANEKINAHYRKIYKDNQCDHRDFLKPPCFKSKCDTCPFRDKCENAEKKFFDKVPYWNGENWVRMD
jgi:MoaA/NifB/PqqE/SkfB family radical SAM enzyme